ncbi:WD40-repeat-containing domain protein [Cunninghamella echinulata]|nr:WD40-repeat-containing domain protein [Cunninghamella echinulata]
MSNTKFKIKFWNKTPSVIIPATPLPPLLRKTNSSINDQKGEYNDNSNNSDQPSTSKGKTKDPWKYIGFVKSDDPKHNNGSKAVKIKRQIINDNEDSISSIKVPSKRSRADSERKNSKVVKKQHAKYTLDKDIEEELDHENDTALLTGSNNEIIHPLLTHQYTLKHALYGHSNDSIYRQEKKKKKKKVQTRKSTKRSKLKSNRGRKRKNSNDNDAEEEIDSDSGEENDHSNNNSEEDEGEDEEDDGEEEECDDDDDDGDDHYLDIWSCEFEPSTATSSSTIAAFCSAHHILFLDTHQGRYLKKYTHPELRECFYSLAWTLLKGKHLGMNEDDELDHSTTILAAAGKLGSIKLLEPLQNHCYRILHGHSQPVLKLSFVKKEPRWLLSSSQDMTVRLWDIGIPSQEKEFSCLGIFKVPGSSLASSISLSYGLSLLVAGTTKADLFQYSIKKSTIEQWRQHTYRVNTNTEEDENENDDVEEDNNSKFPIVMKPKGKFSHGNEWHEGYVDDIYILGQDGNSKNELYKYVVSRGSDDMEILIWDPDTSKQTDADIILSLNWPDNEENTGLRFCIIEENGQKFLLSGDYEGGIRIFNIGDGKISKTLEDGSKEKHEPFKILKHPLSNNVIRDITVSKDGKTVVAVDSSNCVFIWGIDAEI